MQPEENLDNQNADNIMTQSIPEKMKPNDDEKIKMSKKQIIGLVVLSLIAIGGVLFGVYGMNSQNGQIAELTTRATEAEEELAALDAEVDSDDGLVIEDEAEIRDEVVVSNPDSHIYVEGWGLKIGIPEELKIVRYKYNSELSGDSSSLCVMAYKEREGQNSPSFVDNDEYLTCVSRVPKDSWPYGVRVMTDGDYDYLFNNAQTYYSNGDDGASWEKESRELMSRVFGNSENYSTIASSGISSDEIHVEEVGDCVGDGGTSESSR